MGDDGTGARQDLRLRQEPLDANMWWQIPELGRVSSAPTVATTSTGSSATPARTREKRSPDSRLKTVPSVT